MTVYVFTAELVAMLTRDQWFCGNTDNRTAGGHIRNHGRTSANHHTSADTDPMSNTCANTDPRQVSDTDVTAKMSAGSDMDTFAKSAIMVNRCSGIHNAASTQHGAYVYCTLWQHNGTWSELCIRAH
jgi:hypothetical protein